MPATIVDETWNSQTERGVRFETVQIARKFAVGSWSTLRIGARIWLTDSGSAPTSGSIFHFGLNSGTANLPQDASCSHFVGLRTVTNLGAAVSWSRSTTANSFVQWTAGAGTVRAISKLVGTTHTPLTSGTSNQQLWGPVGTSVFRMGMLIMQFVRASASTMDVTLWSKRTTPSASPTLNNLLASMEASNPTTPGFVDAPNANQESTTGAAVNESVDGTLDTFTIGWNRATPFFQVNDMVVMRIA